MIELIYCAGGNARFAEIAVRHGFLYGAQLPATTYEEVYFADQNWRAPDRERYMGAIRRLNYLQDARVQIATVLDWEHEWQYPFVLAWAEELAAIVARAVLIIPKIPGTIERIPDAIGGRVIRLAYSVPTRFSRTTVPIEEFGDRPVHLLGGSPHAQMKLIKKMNVISVDGNYAQKMATRYCQFWTSGNAHYAKNRWWPTLKEADGKRWEVDGLYEAFERSCKNIMEAWNDLR